jgi:hypothetical protein
MYSDLHFDPHNTAFLHPLNHLVGSGKPYEVLSLTQVTNEPTAALLTTTTLAVH